MLVRGDGTETRVLGCTGIMENTTKKKDATEGGGRMDGTDPCTLFGTICHL